MTYRKYMYVYNSKHPILYKRESNTRIHHSFTAAGPIKDSPAIGGVAVAELRDLYGVLVASQQTAHPGLQASLRCTNLCLVYAGQPVVSAAESVGTVPKRTKLMQPE